MCWVKLFSYMIFRRVSEWNKFKIDGLTSKIRKNTRVWSQWYIMVMLWTWCSSHRQKTCKAILCTWQNKTRVLSCKEQFQIVIGNKIMERLWNQKRGSKSMSHAKPPDRRNNRSLQESWSMWLLQGLANMILWLKKFIFPTECVSWRTRLHKGPLRLSKRRAKETKGLTPQPVIFGLIMWMMK